MNTQRINQIAFTLIELLVVIAVIGILSGLIVVSMGGVTDKATVAKSKVFSNSLKNSLMAELVSEWRFDGTGITDGNIADATYVKDSWGINNGTVSNQPLVYSGNNCINGSCLQFDGIDDFITIGSDASLSITDEITIEYWMNKKGTSSNSYCTETVSRRGCYDICCDDLYSIVDGHSDTLLVDGTVPKWNTWYHFTYTYSSNTKIGKFYLNGKLNNTRNVETSYPGYNNYKMGTSCAGLFLSNSLYRLNGLLDEVRIYNKVILDSAIKNSYYANLNKLLSKNIINMIEYKERINSLL